MHDKMKLLFRRFLADESGLSAVEYGLLAAGIAVGLWTLISGMGTSLHSIYTKVQTNLQQAAT
ncbi:MAG TPA: Flp family type IVb pilin [Micropepsaceae bacterium]|jgi:pilus assembly protein Flp/PilA